MGGKTDQNWVFVGKKPTMAYVLAVVTQANQGATEITLKARGKAISRAVDVTEIVRNKFLKDIQIGEIRISTEDVESRDGNSLRVSAIEILLKNGVKQA